MAKFTVQGTYDDKHGNHIDLSLVLLAFQEDKIHFAYCPAFDITGYGNNEEEAYESFQHALEEFLRYTVNKKSLFEELERLGWKINKSKRITKAPSIDELITSNEHLQEIVKEKEFKKINKTVSLPAYA